MCFRYEIVSNQNFVMSSRFLQGCSIVLAVALLLSLFDIRTIGQEFQRGFAPSPSLHCSQENKGECCCIGWCSTKIAKRSGLMFTENDCSSSLAALATASVEQFTLHPRLDLPVFSSEDRHSGFNHTRSTEGFLPRLLRPPRPPSLMT